MAKQERREKMLRSIRARINAAEAGQAIPRLRKRVLRKRRKAVPDDEGEELTPNQPQLRYHVSHDTRNYCTLSSWLYTPENKDDAALKVSLESDIL
jgi:hypothetical protein